ncbi:MAG: IclR family transcriptional regulator [Devosiaceae bacterium]|nr:IclR family transcriptional regulator [Devosiaceae bacterium MH13]
MSDDTLTRSKGVQSVEVGMHILRAFCQEQRPMSLGEIAQAVDIPAAKVHRYLASLVGSGMVVHRQTGTYDLGRMAAEIGMAAVARYDVVNRAADLLPDLVEETGCTAMLSVWGSTGPTIVRWERASTALVTALGVGAVLPLTKSATGLVFLAWNPERLAREQVMAADLDLVRSRLEKIRSDGLAKAEETFIPGLYALAAPVLDLQGQAEAVVTLVSTEASIVVDGSGARRALRYAFPTHDGVVPGGGEARAS